MADNSKKTVMGRREVNIRSTAAAATTSGHTQFHNVAEQEEVQLGQAPNANNNTLQTQSTQ